MTACKKTPKGYYVIPVRCWTAWCRQAIRSSLLWSATAATRSCATIQVRICCKKLCEKCWAAHVHQAGSYEDDERVRFDFTHFNAVTPQELAEVERIVNAKIFEALPYTSR